MFFVELHEQQHKREGNRIQVQFHEVSLKDWLKYSYQDAAYFYSYSYSIEYKVDYIFKL